MAAATRLRGYSFDGPLTLGRMLANSVAAHGDRPALSLVGGEAVTYSRLGGWVSRIGAFLRGRGVGPGDRVAILGDNSPSWAAAWLAVTTTGAVAVPILPDFHPDEIAAIVTRSGSRLVLVSERLRRKLEEAPGGGIPTVVRLEDLPSPAEPDSPDEVLSRAVVREEDDAVIIYTSGTTGFSKGVVLTHRNILSDTVMTTRIIDVGPDDRFLSILPLSHAYECTLGMVLPLMVGASVHYLGTTPSPRVLLPALARVRPTIMTSVPLVIEKIVRTRVEPEIARRRTTRWACRFRPLRRLVRRAAGRKLLAVFGGELKALCIGGAALDPGVEDFLREARFPYAVGYGLTETAPLLAGTDPSGTHPRAIGPPLPGVELRIADPDPATGVGEVQARGPNVMRGYHGDVERTREAFTEDGWFRTGDLGLLDRAGRLHLKGRSKNVILGPSGENIYPEEIEAVINRQEGVLESLVFQLEGRLLAARVHLDYARLAEVYRASEADMRARASELLERIRGEVNRRVSSFSRIARVIEQATPFEKTPTQKIKRMAYQR